MNDSRCGTLDHIYLSYLIDRGEPGLRVRWKGVLRDAWYGILIWLGAFLIVLFVASPAWALVPLGLCFISAIVVTVIRRVAGHTASCSLMYGVHWPLQLGELV